jgi:hypothetical protein
LLIERSYYHSVALTTNFGELVLNF